MREPWIRVHASLADRPVVARLANALRIDPFKAMGHLVTFWGSASRHAANGQIDTVPDSLLEQWAGWRGKRGRFAAWVRTDHMDDQGRVNEWDDYQGTLEQRREKERQRIADKRAALRNGTQGVAQQDANGTQGVATHARERDETRRVTTSPPPARDWPNDPRWLGFAEALPEKKHTAWRAIVGQWLTGERWPQQPRPTPDQVLDGLLSAVTVKDQGPMSENFVAGCIRNVMTPNAPRLSARIATPDSYLAGAEMVQAAVRGTDP